MRLSVLDQSPIPAGSTGSRALQDTIELARLTDRLGFHRFWVAEHHGGPTLAGAAPEVLIGPIAAATQRIRVGSGGVMLPHYSPFKVAEAFSVLAGLFPGRIDLGLGRASGTDPMTTHALQRDRSQHPPDDFPGQLAELLAYLEDRIPDSHPFSRLAKSLPGRPELPVPWLLGSSPQSAIWAADVGLPYAFADFINPEGAPIVAAHRDRLQEVAVCAWIVVADSDEEAWRLAASSRMVFSQMRRGRLIEVPPPDEALNYLRAQGQDPRKLAPGRRGIIGTPARVRAEVEALADEYGAGEVMAVSILHDQEARRRSYELLAEAFDLSLAALADPAARA